MWNEIFTDNDIDMLMKFYDEFHDSCIKEITYISGAYVNSDLSMFPVNNERILKITFQRQSKPITIELEFSGLIKLNLSPNNQEYTCEISDATLIFDNGCIYWGDCSDLKGDFEKYDGTWVCSNKLRWKIVD
jgi:hypothetical protein